MHHKYLIIDQKQVASGSYNFSDNAEHNTIENMVLYDTNAFPGLLEDFNTNFTEIWETGAGLLDPLLESIENSDEFSIVFEPMALGWNDVFHLKSLIVQHCEDIFSDEFKESPAEHLTCTKN